jgi:hypothetical protein
VNKIIKIVVIILVLVMAVAVVHQLPDFESLMRKIHGG